MGSKLPEDLKWSEAAVTLLAETEKKSCKSVCITINKACAEKDKKAQARRRGRPPVTPLQTDRYFIEGRQII